MSWGAQRFHRYALGRLPAGKMNKSEEAYAALLERRKQLGDVLWYRFEGIKLRLADKTFITPDFAVMTSDGTMQLHDVKGFMEEDANVKLKVAADQYPFEFFVCRKGRGAIWDIRPVSNQNRVPEIHTTEPAQCQNQG